MQEGIISRWPLVVCSLRSCQALKFVFSDRLHLVGVDECSATLSRCESKVQAWQRGELMDVRRKWLSLSNAFTSEFKELGAISQFKATAKLGEFLEDRFSPSF
jgi:hypothetical protein